MTTNTSVCGQAREKTRAKRAMAQVVSFLALRSAAAVNCAALVIACVFLFINGVGVLGPGFVFDSPHEMMTEGGVFPCLLGTFLLAAGAILIALPFGVACAVWLNEYGKQGRSSTSFACRLPTLRACPRSCSVFSALRFS